VTSAGHKLEMANSSANDAIRAVAMQRQRVGRNIPADDRFFASAGFRQEVDVRFLVVALRWLREACRLAAAVTGDRRLEVALGEFDAAFAYGDDAGAENAAKDMRDIGEHLADYIAGRGRLQRSDRRPGDRGHESGLGVRIWATHPDGDTHFAWADMEIRLDAALEAAERLYGALREVVASWQRSGLDGRSV
jgi:hypothetical protein